MNTRDVKLFGCLLAVTNVALADASYQETTQITGGQLVDTLKSMPFAPKQVQKMFDPVNSLKMLHGNQLASVSKSTTEIVDLDQETITRIDSDKKTYTVVTFAQMRQAIQDAPKKLEQAQAQMKQQQASHAPPTPPADSGQAPQIQVTYEVSVTDTGVSKAVNGVMAKEQLMTLKAHVTDPNAQPSAGPNTITYSYIADIWTAPEPPEMKEIDDFFMRYGKKMMQGVDAAALMKSMKPAIGGSSIAPLFAGNPGMGPAIQEMMKKMATEMQKIKGTTILEVTRFGGDALTVAPGAAAASPPPPPSPAGSSVATQVATNTATDAASSETSKLGTVGAAFGRSLMGAFHKTPSPSAAPASAGAPASGGTPASSSAVLYEMTTQKSDFSQEAIPASAFQVPASFAKVDSSYVNQLSK
jgi:hypothetical protein